MRNSLELPLPSSVPITPRRPLPSLGVLLTLVLAFVQATYGSAFGAIEFWLALFLAAASTESAGEHDAVTPQTARRIL